MAYKKRAQGGAPPPAAWHTRASPAERKRTRDYITATVKDLRKFFTGFDAAHGYDLRYPNAISAQRITNIKKYGTYLHNLQASPYVKITPHSKKSREVLQEKTAQRSPRQKAYVYHVDTGRPMQVSIRDGVLTERDIVSQELIVTTKYFYFSSFNFDQIPLTMAGLFSIYETYMRHAMPEGMYSMITDQHGRIDVPVNKKFIPDRLQDYFNEYSTKQGFAEAILGFQIYTTGMSEANAEYVERTHRKLVAQQQKSWRARQKRRDANFLKQARGLTRKKPGKKRAKAKGRRK